MARKTDRNFLADFQTLDIEYLPEKGPEVSSDIQMVYVMGNVAPAAAAGAGFTPGYGLPDPIPIDYGVVVFQGLTAGERTRFELIASAGGNGLWVIGILGTSTLVQMERWTIAAATGLANRVLPDATNSSTFGTGAAATAIFDHGTSAVLAPIHAWVGNTGSNTSARGNIQTNGPIYIAAGRVFVGQLTSVAVSATFGVQWREVP